MRSEELYFRAYENGVHDPKLNRLSDRDFRILYWFWCLASRTHGRLPRLEKVAEELHIELAEVAAAAERLVKARLIDIQPGEGLIPHNWEERQPRPRSNAQRQATFREKKRQELLSSGVTQVTDERYGRHSNAAGMVLSSSSSSSSSSNTGNPLTRGKPTDGLRWAEFQAAYPMLGDVDRACQTYFSVVTGENEPQVFACLQRYLASRLVHDGYAMEAWKWLDAQNRGGWSGRWPAAKGVRAIAPAPERKPCPLGLCQGGWVEGTIENGGGGYCSCELGRARQRADADEARA